MQTRAFLARSLGTGALLFLVAAAAACAGLPSTRPGGPAADTVHVRVNLVGYLPGDAKVAVAFADAPVRGGFSVVDAASGEPVHDGRVVPSAAPGWGRFRHYYELDFTALRAPGRYRLRVEQTGDLSAPFTIGPDAYGGAHEELLAFMRQQRCGYNPFLDRICHQRDGRSFYAPFADSTYIDVTGGWHDAGDQLKYLITGSNATAGMLLAYLLEPAKFGDAANALGQPRPNGVPDVLDEARWGLDWLHRLHPAPDQLVHQVADDRDHLGWKWPDHDSSDYGWGPNSYRAAYFATGTPQGLGRYKSEATGVSNLAGRVAAAMALGRNPWGTSMFTGIPRGGEYPQDVHTSVWALTQREVPGGLVDGPVYATIYNSLKGLHLSRPDEFARFQNPYVVYHDDISDYSTNEPTMDGTAGAIYLMAHFGAPAAAR